MRQQAFIGEFCDQEWVVVIRRDDAEIERILSTLAGLDQAGVVAVLGKTARALFSAIPSSDDSTVVGFHTTTECPRCMELHPYWLRPLVRKASV